MREWLSHAVSDQVQQATRGLPGEMATTTSIADNLARLRKARDLSQEQLAEAADVSVDTVARIEQSKRKTVRPVTMRQLATALGVSVPVLLGQIATHPLTLNVATLRRAITTGSHVPGLTDFAEPVELITLDHLAEETHLTWRAYVDGRHEELLNSLPALLLDAQRLIRSTADEQKAQAHRMLSTIYRLAAGIAGRLGFHDLAWSSAERALEAARSSDDPQVETAVSLRYMTWTLVRQGRPDDAEHVAVAAAEKVQPVMLDQDSPRTGVFGNLLFNAASAALAQGQASRATDLLTEAQSAAVRAGRNTASEAAIFGPRVAALQRIDQLVRADDPQRALHIADKLPAASGDVPAFWESGHRLTLAAAAAHLRLERRSLTYLAEARALAPDWSSQQPLGKTTMNKLLDRAPRRRGPDFALLAAHYSVAV